MNYNDCLWNFDAEVFVEEKSFTCMCTIDDEVALIEWVLVLLYKLSVLIVEKNLYILVIFYSPDTFEQVDVKKDLFGKNVAYLKGTWVFAISQLACIIFS